MSRHYMMDTNFKTTLWNTGRRKAWQQKRHTPSKLRHCGHRLWLRLRDDRSEEKGKGKSQPSTPEAETNRTPEREDNDQGYDDFVEDSHCQSRRRRGGGRTSSCPALTAATSLLGTASRASAWPCLKLTGAVCKIAKVWNQFEDVNKLIRHVVNCVQPHPTLPLIATSGIDYDVKVVLCLTLWLNVNILIKNFSFLAVESYRRATSIWQWESRGMYQNCHNIKSKWTDNWAFKPM